MNREDWLDNAVQQFVKPIFRDEGLETPDVRVSVGLPSKRALSVKQRRIGECWHRDASKDGLNQIFVTPLVDNSVEALGILIHEYVHASINLPGHKASFKRAALAVGLTGKMTATTLTPDLDRRCHVYVENAGPYPHSALSPISLTKQGTRMLKLVCGLCGYTIRTTQKWVEVGLPTCVCGGAFFPAPRLPDDLRPRYKGY